MVTRHKNFRKAIPNGSEGGDGPRPKGEKSSRRRSSQLDKLTIDATVVVRTKAPAGSRHKGYEEIVVQDLNLSPRVTRYQRERWQTSDGKTIIAELDSGIVCTILTTARRSISSATTLAAR